MKKQRLQRRGKFWVGGIVWAGAVLLLLTVPSPGDRHIDLSLNGTAFAGCSNYVYSVKRAAVPWYVRSRQWQADIRSLAAALRYLSDADLLEQTNLTPARAGNV